MVKVGVVLERVKTATNDVDRASMSDAPHVIPRTGQRLSFGDPTGILVPAECIATFCGRVAEDPAAD